MDMSAENPFADLMTKAVKLKGAQQAQLRTQFDSWPQYFQHSLFMQDSVISVRSKPFLERIAAAEDMKAAGNDHFSKEALEEAVAEYEKALAVFKYLENKDPGWKKKGIEDTDMLTTDFKCDDLEDQNRLNTLKTSCYLNIAVAKLKLKEFAVCIRACDDALELDPRNVKAYFRRAQALITPASSGALEFDRAISDLQKAIDLTDKSVQQMLHDLQEEERNKKSSSSEKRTESRASPPNAVESVDSLLKSMSNAEITQMLRCEGIDYHKISDREQFLETARHVLLSKIDEKKEPPKPSYARTIILLAVAWTLLRLYTSGGLSVLTRIAMNAVSGGTESNTAEQEAANVMDIFDD
ncbi:hypothetical protein BBO99_00004494 [Phytophthora kernoviae]|uniref:Uncharacterized protein n=2 Tax=Phytophthora kernoviae TaxID=325452 RepID=A0A3R7GZY7_9STRA|nr:hypothetical protein G195_004989 [Phytophthora kernoviae 00238/432]KAG2525503.1 hypothetical protein JM16_004380 [Phytophthora kernoviae]KAG2527244.1 hypothetical protein JM18_003915 [Phytophthora kernoviae]RLN20993.1 hypothetical protein BBI17_004686 [Phytophthora kernoviae]RLN80423.1 hypothetical protein BBO99_00004494 [Phytophthora kernoviae]